MEIKVMLMEINKFLISKMEAVLASLTKSKFRMEI